MTDTKADTKADDKGKAITVAGPDGKPVPVLDFLTEADAIAQAKIIGGTVEHSGVAFSVKPKK